ncbi:hypothetical protein J6590_094617 [Homalodisca vitripennis]|nr:hypothetical protein J6590_083748 [Homalodisca vitripennis]KAG8246003.1 hypothetical protein J6590_094617 [Homalodisca vitripennis]
MALRVSREPLVEERKLVARATLRERHTRQDDKLQLPRVRLEATKRSFSYFGPQEYNALPPVVKTLGRDVHEYETRGREKYRTGRHRTVVYEHLFSQAGVRFINSLPDSMKNVQTPKALKTRLKRFLVSKAFYSFDEFFNYSWETSNLED